MGAMRLVLDRSDQGLPTEVGIDRLGELLADPGIGCGSTSAIPALPRSRCSGKASASTS